ncbi:hypothetical protein [Terrimonas pollutisoli]|uniref:hypothetical protein n=1 Tax=Terrimonas pollutisoli TaxID=3034147 RepID=UPI0023EAF997|nr:hypothetical protein [Terrimonas sp. H1YJ31]
MSKSLKNFIEENRREFDDELPPSGVWRQVERSIGTNKPQKKIYVRDLYKWSAVAAASLLIISGIYFLTANKHNNAKPIVNDAAQKKGTDDISKIAPEYAAEASKIYESIEIQQQQLKTIAKEQPELYSQFAEDLAALDSSYRVLKTQAVQTPNREVIIKAMLQNLQLQAELLSKQLGIIYEFKNNKTLKNEKNNNPRI